jgi:hypothetical protein
MLMSLQNTSMVQFSSQWSFRENPFIKGTRFVQVSQGDLFFTLTPK